jgi:hypothetical protein
MGNCTVTLKRRTGLTTTGQGVIVDIALSTSYATGGDTVTLASLGMKSVAAIIANSQTTPAGHAVEIIHGAAETTAPLLRVRDVATGTQLTAATDNSAQSIRALVVGDLSNV